MRDKVSKSGSTQPETYMPANRWRRRLLLLLGLGVLATGGTLFYVYFWLTHHMGSGPAGPVVDSIRFENIWTERKVILLGFGDSIVAGYGASPGKSFFNRLVENPADEFEDLRGINLKSVMPNLTAINIALSGSTSIEHVDYLLPKIEKYDEETFGVIVATIGGNDVIHMYGRIPPREGAMYGATIEQVQPWFQNYEERLHFLLDEISDHFPGGCHTFLANIYDPTDGIGDTLNAGLPRWPDGLKVLEGYNEIIKRVADQRNDTTLIDIHAEFMGHGIHALQFWREFYHPDDPGYWYYDNLEDPNDRGYDAIRRLMLNQMADKLPSIINKKSIAIEEPALAP